MLRFTHVVRGIFSLRLSVFELNYLYALLIKNAVATPVLKSLSLPLPPGVD